ncbi:Nbp2 protein [Maudiozyma humilis]|uniref:Nbp2 protein n=1 Tax=Maudiozyma humilis TaxID=51915 RepID=A0AAV5RVL8_MAUHU|nr:Nbp2 protein [Kazachstania humilis]
METGAGVEVMSTKPAANDAVSSVDGSEVSEETSLVGYISIRDFAYDESNPLHYGYYDDSLEETDGEEERTDMDEYEDIDDSQDDIDRRQSLLLPTEYIVNKRAVALYDFEPENDNELGFHEGDILFISYRHGQGWLVAENQARDKTGLVPEEFVSFIETSEEEDNNDGEVARPFYLTQLISKSLQGENTDQNDDDEDEEEWEDIDNLETDMQQKLTINGGAHASAE